MNMQALEPGTAAYYASSETAELAQGGFTQLCAIWSFSSFSSYMENSRHNRCTRARLSEVIGVQERPNAC